VEIVQIANKIPGQIIALESGFKINKNFLDRLRNIAFDKKLQLEIIQLCQDKRLNFELWQKTVARELLFLYQWAESRSILERGYTQQQTVENRCQVLSLMPSHGFFVHTLRRALAFSALNIPTEIGCKTELLKEYQRIINFLSSFFGIEDFLKLSPISSKEKLQKFNHKNNILVVTGKIKTSQYLHKIFSGRFYGCSGRFAIAISTDIDSLRKLSNNLSVQHYRNSCTNFKVGFIYKNSRWYSNYRNQLFLVNNFKKTIEAIHPSIVYNIGVQDISEASGYCVRNTDTDGAINDLVGLSADPKFLWPGDFLV